MKILKMLLWFIIIVLGVFGALAAYIYFNQKNMVFFPIKELALTPGQLGLDYEDVYINLAVNEKIHGWYFPVSDSGNSKVVLFCHGNAGNISHRIETAQFLLNQKVNVLMFDFRGYGNSDGEPGEENIYADAWACYDWLLAEKKFKPENVFIFGRSLGGAVAVNLADKVKCGGLVVESSLTSAADMGKKLFPFFPVKWLLRYKFDSIGKIGSVNCPVLITHSRHDDIVPFSMGQALFQAAKEPKQFVELPGKHNERDYLENARYLNAFKRFLNRPR